ncbi:PA domain-containing protein [Thermomonas sp.]|uniref:PA domain-containing protein n=1 Tax=Thermomonas sp. TaxID=1971895 RepID=UPI00248A29A1|nr:PA domain-containing protein [Thermomonas sp.]MDI1253034.1 serine protease [Thermomonas sp.]
MNKSILAVAMVVAGLCGLSGTATAADITLLNVDPAGVGLNDTTPAPVVGGNPGRTVGEQRRIAYQFAMDTWGAVVQSPVQIKIYASFAPLTCTATTGVLGQAGANWIYLLTEAGVTRIYPAALADSLIGQDLSVLLNQDPTDPADIFSQFNGDLGKPSCLPGSNWYYGVDGKTPAGSINFLNVVMHEIGHGLGMSGFLSKTTGALYAGYSDSYTRYAYDNVLNKNFEQMTNAERALAMKSPGRTVWSGTRTNADAALILDNRNSLRVTAPVAAAGSYEVGFATSFGPRASPSNFTSNQIVVVNDGVAGGSVTDGCELPFVNAAAIVGKVALMDRGVCGFAVKAANAQSSGAIGVVIANNAPGVIDMGGVPPITVTIPSVMVSQADGSRIKSGAPATGGVILDPNFLAGADNAGRLRLYSPTTVAGGSTFSHVDTAATPNALMEPFDSPDVQSQYSVDVTPAIFADIGWQLNPGNSKIGKCDTSVDAVTDGGLIIGANVAAWSGICATQAKGNKLLYSKCMTVRGDQMRREGLINSVEFSQVLKCAVLNTP